MSVVLIGIDEAGYGPLLGPLCVAMCAVRVHDWSPGEPAPDLWKRLSRGVVKAPGKSARGRIAINDSKKLKLANDGPRDPLVHLERGVLAALGTMDLHPTCDHSLLATLGAELDACPWYAPVIPIPTANEAASMRIDASMLSSAAAAGGVEFLSLRCVTVCEQRFNDIVKARGTKAAATAEGIREHLLTSWHTWSARANALDHPPRLVCDRQGGRTAYAEMLAELLPIQPPGTPEIQVRVIEECAAQSRYHVALECPTGPRELSVLFQPEAEMAHLTVALASMTAKYCRELLMKRFNLYWNVQASDRGLPELKPTAGYRSDARRWLHDARELVDAGTRRTLVRIA